MSFYLWKYISKNPEIYENLEEDPEVAQKRMYYLEAQKKFKKITKAVSVDESISKYFKEDNTETIENILLTQGINTQNAKETEEAAKSDKNLLKKEKTSIKDIGIPPKKETKPEKSASNSNINNSKPNISTAQKNNLFGNNPKANSTKSSNLFGPGHKTDTNNAAKKTNLFGNPINNNNATQNKKTTNPPKNNLFGTPSQNPPKESNLFGNNLSKSMMPPKTTPPNNQNKNKDLNVSLKIDPKEGNITGINVQGNIDPKDAYNFYQKNKQYMPSGQQMLSGAQKTVNFMNQVNNNAGTADNKKKNTNPLVSLFGTGKK